MVFTPQFPYEHVRTFAEGIAGVLDKWKASAPQPSFAPAVVQHADGSLWTVGGTLVLKAPEKVGQ